MISKISFIVCTYNGDSRISKTLRSIVDQKFQSQFTVEVIVVDNASTDDTKRVATEFMKSSGAAFRVVCEQTPGLSAARMTGFKSACGDIMVLVDDDNELKNDFGQQAVELVQEFPECGIFGGLNTEVCDVPFPDWFQTHKHSFACGPLWNKAEDDVTDTKGYVFGAGMVLRGDAVRTLLSTGWTPASSDRKGQSLSSGGDAELCIAIRMLGYRIRYSERLQLSHRMTKERLSFEYLVRLYRGFYSCPELAFYSETDLESGRPSRSNLAVDLFMLAKCYLMFRSALRKHPHLAAERASWLGRAQATISNRIGAGRRADIVRKRAAILRTHTANSPPAADRIKP